MVAPVSFFCDDQLHISCCEWHVLPFVIEPLIDSEVRVEHLPASAPAATFRLPLAFYVSMHGDLKITPDGTAISGRQSIRSDVVVKDCPLRARRRCRHGTGRQF
jgi:hypothetical protein